MKNYIVKFTNPDTGRTVTSRYNNYKDAHTVWAGMCEMFNQFQCKLIVPMVKKVKKTVKPLFDKDDFEAAILMVEEASKGCRDCIQEMGWARKVLNFFRPKRFKYI